MIFYYAEYGSVIFINFISLSAIIVSRYIPSFCFCCPFCLKYIVKVKSHFGYMRLVS